MPNDPTPPKVWYSNDPTEQAAFDLGSSLHGKTTVADADDAYTDWYLSNQDEFDGLDDDDALDLATSLHEAFWAGYHG